MSENIPTDLPQNIMSVLAAFECCPNMCAWYDSEDRLQWFNSAFDEFYKDYRDIIRIGRPFEDMIREVDARRNIPEGSYDEAWLEKRRAYRVDPKGTLLRPMPNGQWYSLQEWRTPDGGLMSMFTTATEVNEQTLVYNSFMENMRDIVFCRSERGVDEVRLFGKSGESFLGFSSDPESGHAPEDWYSLVHPDDRQGYLEAEKRRKQEDIPFALEYRFRHPKTGVWRWAREVGWNTKDIPTGRVFYDSYVIDRTNAKERETAEQHLREVLDAATDIIAIFSADGRLAYLNSGGVSGLRLDPNFIPAEHRITDFMKASVRHMLLHDAMHQARLNGTWSGELVFKTETGGNLPCSVVLVSHRNTGGQIDRFSLIARDISSQRESEQQMRLMRDQAEEASRAKSRFLATMSHELRTPLNAIIGFSELMETEVFGPLGAPRYHEYLNDIHYSATHLLGLIGDVLDVSRIEAGKIDLEPEFLDVRAISSQMIDMVQTRAQQKSITVSLRISEQVPEIYADDRMFRQCLLNLLSNAIKFTPQDGTIDVAADPDDPQGYHVWVADSGRGIPPDQIDKVLEPFSQVEEDIERRQHEGTGLGLSIVRSLMELQGGSIKIQSELNVGTTVSLYFQRI